MRTAVVVLIVVLLAGGAVFYFGWIQMQLPPETYAVVFTKLKGYDPQPIPPGRFSWRWERLIPTNMTLYRYTLRPFSTETTVRGTLPSADIYSAVTGSGQPQSPGFAYEAKLRVSFRLKPESLVPVTVEEKVTPETLADWYGLQAREIGRRAGELLADRAAAPAGPAGGGLGELLRGSVGSGLREDLQADFPRLEILEISVLDLTLPDLEMYRRVRDTWAGLLKAREESIRQAIAQQTARQEEQVADKAREEQRLELLARYGDLLEKHPVLLKLFYIQGLNGRQAAAGALTNLEVPELELPPALKEGE